MEADMDTNARLDPARLAIYWIVVGVPLIWGLLQTVYKAAALFH